MVNGSGRLSPERSGSRDLFQGRPPAGRVLGRCYLLNFHQRLLIHLSLALRTLRHGLNHHVIRHGEVVAGNAVEHVIKRQLCIVWSAALAADDELLGSRKVSASIRTTFWVSGGGSKKSGITQLRPRRAEYTNVDKPLRDPRPPAPTGGFRSNRNYL